MVTGFDQSGELSQLLSDLKSGKNVVREPVYSSKGMQRNGTDDLAGSYIEVSLDCTAPFGCTKMEGW